MQRSFLERIIGPAIIIGVSTLLLVYIIGFFQIVPYAGLRFHNGTGEVLLIFDETQPGVIQLGDQIEKIGDLSLEEFRKSLTATFWDGASPGSMVPISLEREGEPLEVSWRFTGYTSAEFYDRLLSQWPLAFGFLLFGVLTFISVRPKNGLWLLMVIFNFSAAILLAVGSGASHSHLWYANHLLYLSVWLLVPVMIHLHWLFPIPFENGPEWVEKYLISAVYLVSAPLLILDLRSPGNNLYSFALLISFLISLGLMTFRFIVQKQARQQISLVARFTAVAIFPMVVFVILELANFHMNVRYENGAILTFPLISAGYLFAVWQGQVIPVQFRRNRVLSLSIYGALLIPISVVVVSLISSSQNEISPTVAVALILTSGVMGVMVFSRFQQWVERVILGIPVPMQNLLEIYSKNLADAQAPTVISASMGNLVLPTLLVQQSALLEIQTQSLVGILDYYGITEDQIPDIVMLRKLISSDELILSEAYIEELPAEFQWIRVVMPLTFDRELIGVWLLGARDPDDQYPQQILSMLESIAQQTTFVIINHQKTTRLRALFQANINRNEAERASLSRDLHDETLNQIALLQREYKDPNLQTSLDEITASLRKVIQGIRPDLLSFGLVTALEDLAYSFNERSTSTLVETSLEGPAGPLDGLQETELHIFRIVQQACENALRHAEADTITIEGKISQENIQMVIRDDGKGFAGTSRLDLTALIKRQKYGLSGIYERADLINADLKIESALGKGTQVRLVWPAPNPGVPPSISL
ncbi:hypothetical protein KQH61_03595 [bacterium]|nr:hypothetical protein [bacterium]MCB2178985.1 hypothetical protein [bacterium]